MIDPVESVIAAALDFAGISYTRDAPLDFMCDDFPDIECKRMYSERAIRQLKGRDNVILVQGLGAACALASLIRS